MLSLRVLSLGQESEMILISDPKTKMTPECHFWVFQISILGKSDYSTIPGLDGMELFLNK